MARRYVRARRLSVSFSETRAARMNGHANHGALICLGSRRDRGKNVTFTDKNDAHNALPWQRVWPLAGLAIAFLVNAAWIGLLTYGLTKLL